MKELEPLVFVVDDDQSIRTSLANLLRGRTTPLRSSPAPTSIWRVAHSGPACIVLEVQVPGLDGLALQRQPTEEGRMEQIVLITRHGDTRMGIGCDEARCGRFFAKTV